MASGVVSGEGWTRHGRDSIPTHLSIRFYLDATGTADAGSTSALTQ